MIVKIKPVPRSEFEGRRHEHFLFECKEVEISSIHCDNRQDALELSAKEGCLSIRGQIEEGDPADVLQIWLDQQRDGCKEIYVVGRASVFLMNNEGQTVDRFAN